MKGMSITFAQVRLQNVPDIRTLRHKINQYRTLFEIDPTVRVRGVFTALDGGSVFVHSSPARASEIAYRCMTIDLEEEGRISCKAPEPFDAELSAT